MMTFRILITCILFAGFSYGGNQETVLTKGDEYQIYIAPDAAKVVEYAADELSVYLEKTTGILCSIEKNKACSTNQLVLGKEIPAMLPASSPHQVKPGDDGYRIENKNGLIVFNGGNGRGVLYGVYDFLEKHLNCRWYTSDAAVIPFRGTTSIKEFQLSYNPPVKWRSVYYYDLADVHLAGVLKLNGNAQQQKETQPKRFSLSGGSYAGWGYWCHSLYSMVPPSLYESHPEYFSEINGERVPPAGEEGGTQLCLSNSDVLDLSIEQLTKEMSQPSPKAPVWADSEAYYWSVSQMDGRGNCTCSKCSELDQHDGSPSGSILSYVNKIAAHFPEKKIATLAYIYSRKAPAHTKLMPNVAIQLCAIETARDAINEPIATSPVHKTFRNDMEEWGRICNDIIVWDYVIQFQNLESPFPNFDEMQSNIQFYVKNNATGIFCQGNREKGGEFAELRAYLLSKLLWDPSCDFRKTMREFLDGYYGSAGACLEEYIDLMQAELKKSGLRLSMDGEPGTHRNGYLSEKCIERYNSLFDEAELKVSGSPVFLERVRKARMPLMYAQLKLGYGTIQQRKEILAQFIKLAEKNNVWMLSEVDWRSDQSGNREMFERQMDAKLKASPVK